MQGQQDDVDAVDKTITNDYVYDNDGVANAKYNKKASVEQINTYGVSRGKKAMTDIFANRYSHLENENCRSRVT